MIHPKFNDMGRDTDNSDENSWNDLEVKCKEYGNKTITDLTMGYAYTHPSSGENKTEIRNIMESTDASKNLNNMSSLVSIISAGNEIVRKLDVLDDQSWPCKETIYNQIDSQLNSGG